jgi:hypothetical protein
MVIPVFAVSPSRKGADQHEQKNENKNRAEHGGRSFQELQLE